MLHNVIRILFNIYRDGQKSLYSFLCLLLEMSKATFGHPCIVETRFSISINLIMKQGNCLSIVDREYLRLGLDYFKPDIILPNNIMDDILIS